MSATLSRLETYRKLNAIRTRRMPKVWLHVALSILVMNASAVARIIEGRPDKIRECARKGLTLAGGDAVCVSIAEPLGRGQIGQILQ